MIVGVVFVSLAGFGRDRALQKNQQMRGHFIVSLLMGIFAGVLSAGSGLTFVYSQEPITQAMRANGASEIAANFAVWAAGLFAGAMVNILYPMWLMTKNKSWNVLFTSHREASLSFIMGLSFCIAFALMGKGMLWLGALGASVGFGIYQAMQMLGGQAVGFIAGEWREVRGTPRKQMYAAILILIAAAMIMAYGNSLA